MDYIINGGNTLKGEISVYGAKNCALALLGATVLTDEEIVLNNCPKIVDVENMLKLLSSLGKKIERCKDTVKVCGSLTSLKVSVELASLLRGSALILGGAAAKYHEIELPVPGGCAIGARPMDIHLNGLEAMGVNVDFDGSRVICSGKPAATEYELRFPSVGATENLLCCCALTNGVSILNNCACEPEVEALERMLCLMGAEIQGVGTSRLVVRGKEKLRGVTFDVIPDRIVAATYLSAAIACRGDVTVTDCNPNHLRSFINLLKKRFSVKLYDSAVKLNVVKQPKDYGKVETAPYPLFPTDMQSLLLSLAAFSNGGKTEITEKLFENRLQRNAEQLIKMGAEVKVENERAYITGKRLNAASVCAGDLRGGAGLIIAALNADGVSRVSGIEHVNRGYLDLASNLNSLGADIKIV